MSNRKITADYNDKGIYIYQAFKPQIVDYAVEHGTFGRGFGMDRMTWIKPSFGWMLHRSGYGTKHRQEKVARVHLSHQGFLTILRDAVLTHYHRDLYGNKADWQRALKKSEVRCQWDPDRDGYGRKVDRRAIQLGLVGSMVERYVHQWILEVEDVTALAHQWRDYVRNGKGKEPMWPDERKYEVDGEIREILGMTE